MVRTIRTLLIVLSVVGTTLFGSVFFASIISPGYVEEIAKDIIRHQVEKEVHERIDALDDRFLISKAESLIKKKEDEAESARRQIKNMISEKIASVLAEMRNLDCECRKKIENYFHEGFKSQIASATQAQELLTKLIRTKYMETAERLTREFRIFTGSNTLIFVLLGVAAYFKRGSGLHLLPSALTLTVAGTITGYLYLFNQNWLQTILFNDYVGFAYVVYLLIVFAFLCDVLFNKARVTTQMLSSIGSNIQVLPC